VRIACQAGAGAMMPLMQALAVLARVHTRDDAITGYRIEVGAAPVWGLCSPSEYVEAWESVRHAVGLTMDAAK